MLHFLQSRSLSLTVVKLFFVHILENLREPEATFSLAPVAKRLSELLGQEVKFAADAQLLVIMQELQ